MEETKPLSETRKTYTREELLDICEKSFVPQDKWWDRDSASAQLGVGKCYALLKAGCEYKILFTVDGDGCSTDDKTIWIQFYVHDFQWFEYGSESFDHRGVEDMDYHFYLPTLKRLEERKGGDWY